MTSRFLATPAYGGVVHTGYMLSVLQLHALAARRGITLHFCLLPNISIITLARNELVASFLESDATHLLFIDADVSFEPEAAFRMLDTGRPIVGGVCPMKAYDWNAIRAAALDGVPADELADHGGMFAVSGDGKDGEAQRLEVDHDGTVKVRSVGTGFLLIAREVFDVIAKKNPNLRCKSSVSGRTVRRFFEDGVEDGSCITEDYFFCKLARAADFEVRAFLPARFAHTGPHTFEGKPPIEVERVTP